MGVGVGVGVQKGRVRREDGVVIRVLDRYPWLAFYFFLEFMA